MLVVRSSNTIGILPHGVGQSRAAFDGGPHAGQRLLKGRVFLVGRQNFQALHQRQSGIDHDRELAEEDRDVLGLDLARAEGGHDKFLALFANGAGGDALAPQRLRQRLFVGAMRSPEIFCPDASLPENVKTGMV